MGEESVARKVELRNVGQGKWGETPKWGHKKWGEKVGHEKRDE